MLLKLTARKIVCLDFYLGQNRNAIGINYFYITVCFCLFTLSNFGTVDQNASNKPLVRELVFVAYPL